jgi:hypothetical protein
LWNHHGGIWCCLHGWTSDSIISSCLLTGLEAPSAALTVSMNSRVSLEDKLRVVLPLIKSLESTQRYTTSASINGYGIPKNEALIDSSMNSIMWCGSSDCAPSHYSYISGSYASLVDGRIQYIGYRSTRLHTVCISMVFRQCIS